MSELLKKEVEDSKENVLAELDALRQNIERIYSLRIPTANFKSTLDKTGDIINRINSLVWEKPFS